MSSAKFCSWHRVPRAHVDPIDGAADALAVIGLAVSRPPIDETIVVMLDGARRGVSLIAVDGTTDDDAVVTVVERLTEAAEPLSDIAALVVASVRPWRPVDGADIDRWLEASAVAEERGVELIEWFVISGDGESRRIGCARELLGERPRW